MAFATMKLTMLNAAMMEGTAVLISGVNTVLNAIALLAVKSHHRVTPNIMKTLITQFGLYKFPLDRGFKFIFYTLILIIDMIIHAGKSLCNY